jgi:hypothetical protein
MTQTRLNHSQELRDRIAHPNNTPTKLYTLFLPLHHNNGLPMQPERLNWAQREISRYAGGLTKFAPSVGFWVDPTAKVYRDLVVSLQTVAPTGPEAEAWFARLAAEMAVVLEQQHIFLFIQPVWLLEPFISQATPRKGEGLNGSN